MSRLLELGGVACYTAAIGGWVYGVAEQQRTYGDDAATFAALAALAVGHVVAGFTIGRWWALLLVPIAIAIAVPAGYPDDLRGEPLPIGNALVIWAPAEAALLLLGVSGRKLHAARRWRLRLTPSL
jgi:hypothetical protein